MTGLSARQHYDAAVALHRQDRLAEAERHYRAVRQDYRDHPGALHGLGLICLRTSRFEDAADFLRAAAAAAPQNAAIRSALGQAWLRLGRYDEARRCFEDALALRPGQAAALMGLGDALSILGRAAEARAAFETLLAGDPKHAAAHFGLGTIQAQLGRFAEARRAFETAVALAPKRAAYHRALAECERFGEDDPRLAALEDLSRAQASLADDQKVELHFALAKAHDDLKQYDTAFEHLRQGNGLQRRLVAYDEAAVADFFRAVAAAFTPAVLAARRGKGHASEVPVFVVGMPRSGTTLVEQILASHPEVFGAGELLLLPELIAEGMAGTEYPAGVATLADGAFERLGRAYAERLGAPAPGARRVVDKLPANFRHIGLIHLALPNARIIHVRRDPIDTCLSCYSKLFLNGLNYTYDLSELGRYYKMYEALMAHWRAVLPDGAMLEVRYETLVGNFAAEARRIVAFCGLAWDERCRTFYETERAVRTLSQSQVRQKVFTSSIGRARSYEAWLGPLRDALR